MDHIPLPCGWLGFRHGCEASFSRREGGVGLPHAQFTRCGPLERLREGSWPRNVQQPLLFGIGLSSKCCGQASSRVTASWITRRKAKLIDCLFRLIGNRDHVSAWTSGSWLLLRFLRPNACLVIAGQGAKGPGAFAGVLRPRRRMNWPASSAHRRPGRPMS